MVTGCYDYKLLWVPFMSPAVTSFSSLTRGVKYESTLAGPPPTLSICTLHGNRCTSPQLVRGCLNLIGCFSDDIITLSRGAVDTSLIKHKPYQVYIKRKCDPYVSWACNSLVPRPFHCPVFIAYSMQNRGGRSDNRYEEPTPHMNHIFSLYRLVQRFKMQKQRWKV